MIDVIPAIDLMNGQCVRLQKGDFGTKKVYDKDPVELARHFEGLGLQRLHLVDLDGAIKKQPVNLPVLERIAKATSLTIDFGGGLRTRQHLQNAFEAGAAQVTCGSIAAKDPETFSGWLQKFGAEKFVLAADVHGEQIAVHGWKETADLSLWDFLQNYWQQGIRHVLCTDISKDGMLQGTAVPLYQQIMRRYPHLYLVASGGVSNRHDLELLEKSGIPAVVTGKAIYEGRLSDEELASFARRG